MFEDFTHEMRFRLTAMLDERRPLDGLLGLPAIFALILLLFMFLNSRGEVNHEHQDMLQRTAQNYLDKGRFVEARIVGQRLAQTEAQNLKAAVIEAKALRGMGKEKEAARLLSRVAPVERPGYSPAHVMQAAIQLSQEKPDSQIALRHIAHALQVDPANQDALELAARISAGQKEWKTVLRYLDQMSLDKRADLMLMKATALQFTGLKDESVKCAKRAEDALRDMNDTVSTGADRIRYSIAVSLSLQRQFEQALKWMMDATGGKLIKEDRQVVGGIYLSWSRHLKDQPAVDKLKVLQLLENGLQVCPDSQDIIVAFLNDCAELSTSADERQRYVERVLGDGGIATSFLHYYLGVQDWKQGDRQSARSHFELASSLNPGFKVISNNLAMAIASTSSDHDELEKALAMMNELIHQEPENPFFLDTRGHVHAKMRQFREAVNDLERALPKARDKDATHAKLADLYEHLGMKDLAVQHRSASLVRVLPVIDTRAAVR